MAKEKRVTMTPICAIILIYLKRHQKMAIKFSKRREAVMTIYAFTVFLSAFLLFLVQPMIAKYLLPWFGGTPAMWSTCILFFQMLLLGGYFYAHILSSRLRPRTHSNVHIVVIGTAVVLLVISGTTWMSPITPGRRSSHRT